MNILQLHQSSLKTIWYDLVQAKAYCMCDLAKYKLKSLSYLAWPEPLYYLFNLAQHEPEYCLCYPAIMPVKISTSSYENPWENQVDEISSANMNERNPQAHAEDIHWINPLFTTFNVHQTGPPFSVFQCILHKNKMGSTLSLLKLVHCALTLWAWQH